MLVDQYRDFLIACVGASASFIGLLYVGLSVVLSRQDAGTKIEFTDRRLAESAFTALANIFFVSLIALMPGNNVGWTSVIVALVGIRSAWVLYDRLQDEKKKSGYIPKKKSEISWIFTSLLVYIVQAYWGTLLIINPANSNAFDWAMVMLIILFGGGLVRSWELTGIRAS